MKRYRWLIFLAALLITVCDVVLFSIELPPTPQKQASGAAVANVGGAMRSSGG